MRWRKLMMNKKNKWLKRAVLLIVVLLAIGVISFASYVLKYDKQLLTYQESLSKLPEVKKVLEISQYNGEEQYYVAKVQLTSGKDYYYFIKDNTVKLSCETKDLMTKKQVEEKVANVIDQGVIKHYYLGVYGETPIYEVLVTNDKGDFYVILDAKTSEVLLQFKAK